MGQLRAHTGFTSDREPLAADLPPTGGEAALTPPRERNLARWISRGFAALLALLILAACYLAITAPLSKSLKPISPPQITLLAADGTPIARSGALVEAPVRAKALPRHVPEAFLAIEDRRFYSHWGIDPRGIARAAWVNLTTGKTQGGSTITQQLAKITFLTADQSLIRKLREVVIAFWLEVWLTKDQILERYLSNAYFGDNAYGLRAASLHYFRRQPEALSRGQAAMLAGLVKAPSRLAPTRNYRLAERRMRVVLHAMVDAGYLSAGQAARTPAPRLDLRARSELPTGTYFADWALPEARKIDADNYTKRTYTTTLDARLQAAARRAIARAPLGRAQVALVAMRPTGEVVAMIGGRDYAASPFNRATQARRQPGSTFKLFVYVAALENGWEPTDRIANTPITTGSYRPQNPGNRYSPTITLQDAFARSSNVAAVRLFGEVGPKAVIRTARRFGVVSPLPEGDTSLALGSASVTLLELTSAYAGVAANRFPVKPTAFAVAEQGWINQMLDGRHSLSSGDHEAIEQMLRGVVSDGTGRSARLQRVSYGKTGTSQDNRDALFVGYVRDLVVGVWVGNDDNSPLKGVSGGGLPAQIWRDFVRDALGERAAPKRPPPPTGPVEPFDLPAIEGIDGAPDVDLRLENDGAVIGTRIGGMPIDLRIDEQGLRVDSPRTEESRAAIDRTPTPRREEFKPVD